MEILSHDFQTLAQTHGTPFYLYDLDAARLRISAFRSRLPSFVELIYAVKANANPRILSAFRGCVDGVDISSAGEIDLAVAAGWNATTASFAGPGKTDRDLVRAIEASVGTISVESERELLRLSKIAQSLGKTAAITLRLNPLSTPKEFAMKMGGNPSQFGVPEEDAERIARVALQSPHIRLRGFHIYAGTQCLEINAIVQNARQTLEIVERLCSALDFTPELVNLGGGFGIPYFADQSPIDDLALADALGELLTSFRSNPRFASTRPVFELGRFLIGMHGLYVSRVVDVKETRGKRIVILDGGMHHCFPATGFFGQLVKKNYVVRNLSAPSSSELVPQELVGPLCTPMDSMARNLALPLFDIGDLAAVCNVGAYGFSASPLLFLGHDTPPEIVYIDGLYSLARPSRSVASFF